MFWLNLLVLALLAAGHTELLVTLVNRVHARPMSCSRLRQIRHLHDALVPLFPIVLLLFVGIGGPGLLVGGRWADVPLAWRLYLGVCGLGTLGLFWSAVRWQLGHIPQALVSNHTEIVDMASRLGRRPLGDGPFHSLARLPGNEVFQLEVSRKTYRVARLPADWDGFSILHLTDLHLMRTFDRSFFEEVTRIAAEQEPHLIVFTGDLLDDQSCADWLPTTLGRLNAPLGCYFILGNHDWYLRPHDIRKRLAELGWQNVAGKTATVDYLGRQLIVGGTERPWMGAHPDFSDASRDSFRLLLSHTPDHIEWAREQRVDLMLSGHNHGGQVVLPVVGPVYAPSRYGVTYAAGTFQRDPTLLYVSRGISGRHPLRWNCRPEMTTLVLRSAETQESDAFCGLATHAAET